VNSFAVAVSGRRTPILERDSSYIGASVVPIGYFLNYRILSPRRDGAPVSLSPPPSRFFLFLSALLRFIIGAALIQSDP
jgi:hypothetical protein